MVHFHNEGKGAEAVLVADLELTFLRYPDKDQPKGNLLGYKLFERICKGVVITLIIRKYELR